MVIHTPIPGWCKMTILNVCPFGIFSYVVEFINMIFVRYKTIS